MTNELDAGRKGFLIKGSVPLPPRIPIIDSTESTRTIERLAAEDARKNENTSLLTEDIREILSQMEQKLYGTACIRYQNGEYEPKSRFKKEKTSIWSADVGNAIYDAHFYLDFNAKRRKVTEVNNLRMGFAKSELEISLINGEITKVNYEYDPKKFLKRESEGRTNLFENWFDEVIIGRGFRKEIEFDRYVNDRRVWDGITFTMDPPSLEVYTKFDTNPGVRVSIGGPLPEPEPLQRDKTVWTFNPDKNRFNARGEDYKHTPEEIEELVNKHAEGDENMAVEYRKTYNSNKIDLPVLSPNEFTHGLSLLLDTIPLD